MKADFQGYPVKQAIRPIKQGIELVSGALTGKKKPIAEGEGVILTG